MLTDERIKELRAANTYAMDSLGFARAIEAEVLQSCRAQNAIHTPQDESRYCPDCEALQDRSYELKAEADTFKTQWAMSCADRDALQAKVAEQLAEIERLKREDFGPERIANHTLKTVNSVLAERIAELEQNGRVNTGDGTGGTAPRFGFDCTVSPPEIVPATNGAYVHYSNYLELFKQRTASNELIEQCEKALLDNSETWDALDRRKPALAAIAAHRGAAIAKDAP